VEHACYKCGSSVEDGTPFCARCNAPQIRVAGLEPCAPGELTPELTIEPSASYTAPLPLALEWRHALISGGIALLPGIFTIALSKSGGLGMFVAGFLCVVLYRRRYPIVHVTVGTGVRLGAVTGILGFGVVAATLAVWTAFRSGKEIHDAFLTYLQQNLAQTPDPRVQQVIDLFNTPEGFTFIMIFSLILILIAFLIFSSLGGAVGAFLLHRKERP
jgi:hypothetical protein